MIRPPTGDEEYVIQKIFLEYRRACSLHSRFNSAHEGYAVIKEEYEELWDEIKKKKAARSGLKMANEAYQLGAMAMRFVLDICLVREDKMKGGKE